MILLLVVILSHSIYLSSVICWQRYKFSFELLNVIATIFLRFYANSCRKVSKKDKIAAKSNNFWDFMLDIVEKVLTLQRI